MTTQSEPLDISKALDELFREAIGGVAHLNAAKSLIEAEKSHPVIMKSSPSFFRLTTQAHLQAAQFAAVRLFDEHKDCVGIPWLLRQASLRPEEFRNHVDAELDDAFKEAQQTHTAIGPLILRLKCRRDKFLAHLDKKAIRNSEQFETDAKLTYSELDGLLKCAAVILDTVAALHGDAGYLIFDDDYDDLSHTLNLIEKGAQANAQESA